MDRIAFLEVIIDIVTERVGNNRAGVDPETHLGASGLGLDSIEILDLVLEVERRTGVLLRDESLTAAALETPLSLADFLVSSRQR